MSQTDFDRLPEWLSIAKRLQLVRRTCAAFLDEWAASKLADDARGFDRVASDIAEERSNATNCKAYPSQLLDESSGHDWSLLYRGSVLDD